MSTLLQRYEVMVPGKVRKQISRLPIEYQKAVYSSLKSLEEDPFLGKKLEDQLKNKYSLRVGVYRILYEIFKEELIILVVSVAHRGEAYRRK